MYTFGATGILNALDARDGRVVWSRNVGGRQPTTKVPDWGFASSPLLVGDLVIVAAAGKLVAYDRATGAPRWFGPDGGAGYSSPHLLTIHGVPQILLLERRRRDQRRTGRRHARSGSAQVDFTACRRQSSSRRSRRTATS